MKTKPINFRDSWVHRRWGAKGVKAYHHLSFGLLEAVLAHQIYNVLNIYRSEAEISSMFYFLVLVLAGVGAIKLVRLHAKAIREVREIPSASSATAG